jgi:tetratricopeptide (TPR) repeat protein
MPLLQKLVSRLHAGTRPRVVAVSVSGIARGTLDPARVVEGADALQQKGAFSESLACIDDALAQDPNDSDLLFARAATLFAWGRYTEARALLIRVEQMGRRDADLSV